MIRLFHTVSLISINKYIYLSIYLFQDLVIKISRKLLSVACFLKKKGKTCRAYFVLTIRNKSKISHRRSYQYKMEWSSRQPLNCFCCEMAFFFFCWKVGNYWVRKDWSPAAKRRSGPNTLLFADWNYNRNCVTKLGNGLLACDELHDSIAISYRLKLSTIFWGNEMQLAIFNCSNFVRIWKNDPKLRMWSFSIGNFKTDILLILLSSWMEQLQCRLNTS